MCKNIEHIAIFLVSKPQERIRLSALGALRLNREEARNIIRKKTENKGFHIMCNGFLKNNHIHRENRPGITRHSDDETRRMAKTNDLRVLPGTRQHAYSEDIRDMAAAHKGQNISGRTPTESPGRDKSKYHPKHSRTWYDTQATQTP
jgi:hypothetical protein